MVRTRWIGPRVVATALGLALLAGLGGCKGDNGGESSETTTTAAPTTTEAPTTTLSGPEQDAAAVKAAVQRFWDVYLVSLESPDPADPSIGTVAAGAALTKVQTYLTQLRDQQRYVRRSNPGPLELAVGDPLVQGDHATVFDCVVDDAATYGPGGTVLDDSVSGRQYSTDLARSNGAWLVVKHEQQVASPDLSICRGVR